MSPSTSATAPLGGRPSRRTLAIMVLLVMLVAFVARLVPVLRGGGLDGVLGYDDGVYFTGAAALVGGRLPYSEFTLLHPPAIVLLLAPFAWVGRLTSDHVGLAVARLAFMALGAVNAGLVALVASRVVPRVGRAAGQVGVSLSAAAFGGLFYALWYPAVYTTRTTLLEGGGTTGLLVAMLFVWRRTPGPWASFAAGAALGFGTCIKIWGVVPFALVALWVWRQHGRGAALRLVGGSVAIAALVCGPFFAAAPGPMVRMVVLDQLNRPVTTPSLVTRALDASSLERVFPHLSGVPGALALAPIAVVVLLCCVVAWRAGAALPVLLLLATGATLVLGPSYFTHYGEFVAAPLALVLAAAVAAWRVPRRGRAHSWLSVAVPVLVLLLLLPALTHPLGRRLDRAPLQQAVADARCVATETPSLLAITDSLTRSLDDGCDVPVDVTGAVYDRFHTDVQQDGRATPRLHNTRYQRYLIDYFLAADAQIVVHAERTLINEEGLRRLHANQLAARQGPTRVYRRR